MKETINTKEIYVDIMNIFRSEVKNRISEIFCGSCLGSFGEISDSPNVLRCTSDKCRKNTSICYSAVF